MRPLGDDSPYPNLYRALVASLVGVLVLHVAAMAFLCDDAYISFRYVRNLVDGHGLVFNPGYRVEGYSNFLWVLQLAAADAVLGVGPERASLVLGLVSTAATVVAVVSLARGTPRRPDLAVLLTLLFLSLNRSFAIWSTSGLEQRQLTLFLLLAILAARAGGPWLWGASVLLGLAELTRPETLLFGPILVAWWAGRTVARGEPVGRGGIALAVPFLTVVALHLAFRLAYYGDPLPNTYYAKVDDPWFEAGLGYLGMAAVEHGLVVLGPLAVLGLWARLRRGDDLHLLSALLVVPHLAYVAKIGGDHFEYRMLDLCFPLLHLAAADGVVEAAAQARRVRAWLGEAVLGGLLVVALAYALAIPVASFQATGGEWRRQESRNTQLFLLARRAPWLDRLPLMPLLSGWWRETGSWCVRRMVGTRHVVHRAFWLHRHRMFRPYAEVEDFPRHLVMAEGAVGVMPFFLPRVHFVDSLGLTDPVVARNRVEVEPRLLAHSRRPPWGHYERQGVNADVGPAMSTVREALDPYPLAVRLDRGLWMTLDRADAPDVLFAGRTVVARFPLLPVHPASIPIWIDGQTYAHHRDLWTFDRGHTARWIVEGDAFDDQPRRERRRMPVRVEGFVGDGHLDSWHPEREGVATGRMRSMPFTVDDADVLAFLVGGGDSEREVGVRLLGPDGELARWSGRDSARLYPVAFSLRGLAGVPLELEVFDFDTGEWGFVVADQFVLLRAWNGVAGGVRTP